MNYYKIAYVIDNLSIGGTQTALTHLAKGMAARGWQQKVWILNETRNDCLVQNFVDSRIELDVVGRANAVAGVGLCTMLRGMRQFAPDLVQTLLPWSDRIGRPLGRLAGATAVVSSVRSRNIDKHWLGLMIDRATAPLADAVVFNSSEVIDYVALREGVKPKQIVVISNGVAPFNIVEDARVRVRDKLGIRNNMTLIGAVGRLGWEKGYDVLLEAFAKVSETNGELYLVVAGEGGLLNELRGQARRLGVEEKVWFLGSRSDIAEVLGALDIFVHAARFEGMPNAVMEAMAAGLPIVCTNVDGARELIVDGKHGLLVQVDSVEELSEALRFMLNRPAEGRKMGRSAAERVRNEFSVSAMVDKYESLYRNLLKPSETAVSGY